MKNYALLLGAIILLVALGLSFFVTEQNVVTILWCIGIATILLSNPINKLLTKIVK